MVPRKAKASWVTRSITICSEDVTVVARRSTPVAAGTDTMLAAAAAVMPATLQPGPAAEIRMFRTPPGRQPGISSIAALPVLHLPVEVAEVIRLAAPTRMRFHSDPSIVPGAATSVETMAAWVVVRWITRPAGFSSAAAGALVIRTIQREVRAVMAADSRIYFHSEMSAAPERSAPTAAMA